MPLGKSHSYPTFEQRLANKESKHHEREWLKADDLVSNVFVDISNGITKSEIMEKLTKGVYPEMKKGLSVPAASTYLRAAYDRLRYDFDLKKDDLLADLYGKLSTIYQDAIKIGDRSSALQAVDKIMKLTGVSADKPQTAIQINSDTENGITINFGFQQETNED